MKIISDKSLNKLYLSLVTKMKNRNLPVFIVGGHACIEYGLAEFTKDLDIVSPLNACGQVLEFLSECEIMSKKCRYRFGLKMLNSGDISGLLYVYDEEKLREAVELFKLDKKLLNSRPVLRLALENSPMLARAIKTEIDFWSIFDRRRLAIYKNAWEGYFKKINKINLSKIDNLIEEHNTLLEHAVKSLSAFPLNDYGISRLFNDSRTEAMTGILDEIEEYLPDTSELENYLERMKMDYEKIKTA